MTNLGWIRCRTCSSSFSMISSGATSSGSNNGIIIASISNLNGGDHLMRRSHFRYYYRYYRPWINCNQYTGTYHYNKQQQIAQFCKKAKKIIKDNNAQAATGSFSAAVTSNNTGTTATPTCSSSPPPKNLRRKKKDNVGTTSTNTSSNSNSNQYHETRILVPLSEQYRNVLAVRASSPNGAAPPSPTMTCVYVHPLSQMVLLYLQSYCHDWVQARQLQHLNLQVDGTFRVRSVGVPTTTTTAPPLRRPTLIHRDALVNGTQPTMMATTRHVDPLIVQIWTKYEKEERKHWLCAAVVTDHSNTTTKPTNHHGNSPFDDMVEPKWQNRYLLQDNTVTPWQSYSQQRGGGTPERIQSHVQALIRAVDAALVEPTSV